MKKSFTYVNDSVLRQRSNKFTIGRCRTITKKINELKNQIIDLEQNNTNTNNENQLVLDRIYLEIENSRQQISLKARTTAQINRANTNEKTNKRFFGTIYPKQPKIRTLPKILQKTL
jgi:hypothetical protein